MRRVGFTGTSEGMTAWQRISFAGLIVDLDPDEFHHGVCVGADEEAHEIVRRLLPACRIIGHPGIDPVSGLSPKRSETAERDLDLCLPERPYMARNSEIARFDFLVAAPAEMSERLRSGTWATVRRRPDEATPTLFVYPGGGPS